MSKSVMDNIYGVLSKEYCLYFYILSVIGFVILFCVVLFTILFGIMYKKTNFQFYLQMFMICIPYIFIYFTNRLLFSMCVNSLK